MFELKNVSKYYNSDGVLSLGLRNINLSLKRGEIVAITGDSGAGKSTLLNVISGVDNYDEGEIYFEGNETSYFNQDDLDLFRKKNISFIFQKYNIIDSYTVLENVMLPLIIKGMKEKDAKAEALKLIEKVGLKDRASNKGAKLSGGEKQRCVIARALATHNKVLACDEPTGNLDSKTGDEIVKLIKEISKDKLVLIVTHNYEQVKDIATRHLVLKDGEIIKDEVLKEVKALETLKPLDLETLKIKESVINKVSYKNIIRTPKKSVLTFFIFLMVSLITTFLLAFAVKGSSEGSVNKGGAYNLKSSDRMIVYKDNHEGLDSKTLLNNKNVKVGFENAFYEDFSETYTTINRFEKNFYLTESAVNYDLKRGIKGTNEGEFVLVIPSNDDISRYSDFYDLDLLSDFSIVLNEDKTASEFKNKVGKIVGLGKSKDVLRPYLVGKPTINHLNSLYNSQITLMYEEENIVKPLYIKLEDSNLDTLEMDYPETSLLKVPTSFKNNFKYYGLLKELYKVNYDFKITYTDEVFMPTLVLGKDFLKGEVKPEFKETYELSLYVKDIKKMSKDLDNLNLNYSITKKAQTTKSQVAVLKLYGFMLLIFLVLSAIFFITYAILSRVYATKSFTYGVLRSLGMVKKDLRKVVTRETLTLNLASLLVSFLLFLLINLSFNLGLLKYFNFFVVIFSIVINLGFSFLISRKFNQKLFKFSLTNDFKAGVLND